MKTVTARFDGRAFVPDQPVDLPVGYRLEIPLPAQTANGDPQAPVGDLIENLDRLPANPDWPSDGAAQHDHYLYGTPKKP